MTTAGEGDGDGDGEAHGRFLRSRPPRAGLLALVEDIEPGATIARVRRLKGGLEASTHRLDLATRSGALRSVVLRRFNPTFHCRPSATRGSSGCGP